MSLEHEEDQIKFVRPRRPSSAVPPRGLSIAEAILKLAEAVDRVVTTIARRAA